MTIYPPPPPPPPNSTELTVNYDIRGIYISLLLYQTTAKLRGSYGPL